MKPKQLRPIQKYVIVCQFRLFQKNALVGFRYETVCSDVSKVCFEEEQDIPNKHEK